MTSIETAKSRAEELLQNLRTRAREFVEAEEGLVASVRTILDDKGLAPNEVRKRLEEVLGRIRANKVYNDAASAISDYRGEFERRFDGSLHRIIDTLSLVSKDELHDVMKQVTELNLRVVELSNKLDAQNSKQSQN